MSKATPADYDALGMDNFYANGVNVLDMQFFEIACRAMDRGDLAFALDSLRQYLNFRVKGGLSPGPMTDHCWFGLFIDVISKVKEREGRAHE